MNKFQIGLSHVFVGNNAFMLSFFRNNTYKLINLSYYTLPSNTNRVVKKTYLPVNNRPFIGYAKFSSCENTSF